MMNKDSIFLTGWEYNRVLASDPTAPIVSGLPAQALWDGAAQFWLFKNVYCTTEALNGDLAAFRDLNWTTGYIFGDMARRGFLHPIDLRKEAEGSLVLRQELVAAHTQLRQSYNRKRLFSLINGGMRTN